MLRELTRRPSIAVAVWGTLVLGLFALHGDLRVSSASDPAQSPSVAPKAPLTVSLRREQGATDAAVARGRIVRRARVYDSMGFLLVGAEVVPETGASTRTDADGAFDVELDRHRGTDVLVRSDGRRPQWVRWCAGAPEPLLVRLEPAAPWDPAPAPAGPTCTLRAEGTVRGTDGQPLPQAFVRVVDTDCWGRSDEFGRVEIPLPAASVALVVHQPDGGGADGGFAAAAQSFVAPRERGVVPMPDLVAGPALSLRGTVRGPRGQPVVGAPIEVVGGGLRRYVETGASGAFRIAGLTPGDYRVHALASRGAVAAPVSVQLDRPVVDCDLQLVLVPEQPVRVVDEAGNAAANVWVASSSEGVRRAVAQADRDGYVRVPVPPTAEFEVRAADTFAVRDVRRFAAAAEPPTLVVAAP